MVATLGTTARALPKPPGRSAWSALTLVAVTSLAGLAALAAAPVAHADPLPDAWTFEAAATRLPSARSCAPAVWDPVQKVAYIFGGYRTVVAGGSPQPTFLDEIVRYDPVLDRLWVMHARLPFPTRCMVAVWSPSDGSAYLFGGLALLPEAPGTAPSGTLLDSIWKYTPQSDTLTVLNAKLPEAEEGMGGILAGHQILVFGGDDSAATDLVTQRGRTISSFDPATQTVHTFASRLAQARRLPGAAWDANARVAYVLGGEDDWTAAVPPVPGLPQAADIQRFDPATDTLTATGLAFPAGAQNEFAQSWDGQRAILMGGEPGATSIQEFVVGGAAPKLSMRTEILPRPMEEASAVWTGTQACIFGGATGDSEQYSDEIDCMVPSPRMILTVVPHDPPCDGQTVVDFFATFTPATLGVVLAWDFGDGAMTTTGGSPTGTGDAATTDGAAQHAYDLGSYMVTLIGHLADGSTRTVTRSLPIAAAPSCSVPAPIPPGDVWIPPIPAHAPRNWVPHVTTSDSDGDGVQDVADDCPGVIDPDQVDSDHDGQGDLCDADPQRAATAVTTPRTNGLPDRDRDGVADTADNCPFTPNRDQADFDADEFGDKCDDDMDGDGVVERAASPTAWLDNCPKVPNADQRDTDGDGHGDACSTTITNARPPRAATGSPAVRAPSGTSATPALWAATVTLLGAGVAALAQQRRRVAIVILFSRIAASDLLTHPTRAELLQRITEQPGISPERLVGSSGRGRGVVEYHLAVLERSGHIRRLQAGRQVAYAAVGSDAKRALADRMLAHPTARAIAQRLTTGPLGVSELAHELGVRRATAVHHVERLMAAGFVQLEVIGEPARLTARLTPVGMTATPTGERSVES